MNELKGITITENASLKNLNTYKIESSAKYLIRVENLEGLINILKYLKEHNIKYFILGAGSNIVIDDYFDGAIIKLDGLNKVTVNDKIITAEAGAMMGALSCESINHNLTGLEWAINIPGTIGGSIVGNAGAYNKEMFDAAGVAYPDESWTWDNLVEASQQIYDATGKYGYMAYADEQLGYWNFVYQAGGQILTEDKTKGDFLNPGTKKGMEFYIGLQDYEWCPDQNYFAQTNPGTAFFSSQGAMYLEGNWNLLALLQNNPEMEGKWDVAVLPKCPDPVKGDGRATISNDLCYVTGARGKNKEAALDFIKFLGTEEGQRIQGESGVAIPAYEGLEDTWMQVFEGRLSVQKCVDMFEYGVQSVNNASRPNWKSEVSDILIKMYTKELTIDEGLQAMQEAVDEASAP